MLPRALPAGFIAPRLPSKTDKLPSGSQWLHEIKHDGFRLIARKSGSRVRLYSRPGNDFTPRFPLIVDTLARLRSRSCIIDGEAVACDDHGGVERTLPLIFTVLTDRGHPCSCSLLPKAHMRMQPCSLP
jgi:ATP-dependent DNA ligase